MALFFMEGIGKGMWPFIYLLNIYISTASKKYCGSSKSLTQTLKETSSETRFGEEGKQERRTIQFMPRSALAEHPKWGGCVSSHRMGNFSSPQRGHPVGYLSLEHKWICALALTTAQENCLICIFLQHPDRTLISSLRKIWSGVVSSRKLEGQSYIMFYKWAKVVVSLCPDAESPISRPQVKKSTYVGLIDTQSPLLNFLYEQNL